MLANASAPVACPASVIAVGRNRSTNSSSVSAWSKTKSCSVSAGSGTTNSTCYAGRRRNARVEAEHRAVRIGEGVAIQRTHLAGHGQPVEPAAQDLHVDVHRSGVLQRRTQLATDRTEDRIHRPGDAVVALEREQSPPIGRRLVDLEELDGRARPPLGDDRGERVQRLDRIEAPASIVAWVGAVAEIERRHRHRTEREQRDDRYDRLPFRPNPSEPCPSGGPAVADEEHQQRRRHPDQPPPHGHGTGRGGERDEHDSQHRRRDRA